MTDVGIHYRAVRVADVLDHLPMSNQEIDPADIRNGWTSEALAKYRAEREAAHPLVGGNVITEYRKPKPAKFLIGAKQFNPHDW